MNMTHKELSDLFDKIHKESIISSKRKVSIEKILKLIGNEKHGRNIR
jgi:hypothetical protein